MKYAKNPTIIKLFSQFLKNIAKKWGEKSKRAFLTLRQCLCLILYLNLERNNEPWQSPSQGRVITSNKNWDKSSRNTQLNFREFNVADKKIISSLIS